MRAQDLIVSTALCTADVYGLKSHFNIGRWTWAFFLKFCTFIYAYKLLKRFEISAISIAFLAQEVVHVPPFSKLISSLDYGRKGFDIMT